MALASAIEAKDKYTMGHTERVSKYSLIIAGQLRRMKKAKVNNWDKLIDDLRAASLLHDIGKIGVPESILNKNGSLTDKEWKEIKKHPSVGFSILEKVDEFGVPILGVKHHHERYDGEGYPDGLKKDEIPLIAQIISIADTYDAMSSDRPYRKQICKEKVLELIKQEKGKQFSPIIVEAFLGACNKGKI
jgi:HD-GYP domain-containing protein (c-di-GMP phosphodiesterase class II)